MKIGLNLAPTASHDTIIFSDLLAQCQPPRRAPNWNPGAHEPGSAIMPGDAGLLEKGLAWTVLRDGAIVPAEYLSGDYLVVGQSDLIINSIRYRKGDVFQYDGQESLGIYIDSPDSSWMPSLVRYGTSHILQPKIVSALDQWDFVRVMEPFMVQHKAGYRFNSMRPWTVKGIDYQTACQLGKRVDISIDLDTVISDDHLREVLKLIAEKTTGPVGLFVCNEVWNTGVFPEAVRLLKIASGNGDTSSGDAFWKSMKMYAALTTKLYKAAREIIGDRAIVQCETNQHIGGLTELLQKEAQFDMLMLNGYLYMDSEDPDIAKSQLLQSIHGWVNMSRKFTTDRWGVYEQNFHVDNAGTLQANPNSALALQVITRADSGATIMKSHLDTMRNMGCEQVAAYCLEREPRHTDSFAVSEFGIRQGLLQPDRDSRFEAYQLATMGQSNVPPVKPKNPIVPLVRDLRSQLRGAADSLDAILKIIDP